MNLDELRSVQEKERRKDSLQHLRDSFYDDVAAYIADLRAARDRRAERVDNPFSDEEVRRMSDEIETAEEVSEALYERRVGKVVKLASFAAAGMPAEEEGMTDHERALYDDLVDRIEGNKETVLDVIAGKTDVDAGETDVHAGGSADEADGAAVDSTEPLGGADAGADGSGNADALGESPPDTEPNGGGMLADAMGDTETDEAASEPDRREVPPESPPEVPPETSPDRPTDDGEDDTENAIEPNEQPPTETDSKSPRSDAGATEPPARDPAEEHADSPGSADGSADEGSGPVAADRTTVRITEDVGAIFGVDEREYELAAEDVVTLPEANAEPLVKRDAAEKLE